MTRANAVITRGIIGTAVLTSALYVAGLADLVPSLAAAAFLVLLPAVAIAQPEPDFDLRPHRLGAYGSSIVLLAAMGLVAFWLARDLPFRSDLWLAPPSSPAVGLVAVVVLTLAGIGVVYLFRALSPRFNWIETDTVRAMMPETPGERRTFAVLSMTAGLCEELVYRAFVPAVLLPWLGSYLLAAVPATAAFGLLHAYQGRHGIARTALMGFVLALGVAWSGSVWPSIAAHAILDLLLGLVLARSLLGSHTGSAVAAGPEPS